MPSTLLQPAPDPVRVSPSASPRRERRAPRVALLLALFCAGLFGVAALIDRQMPFSPVPTVKNKIDWLAQHGDTYDTLFIGSSRANLHIQPELFDRLMAQAGMPTHSFNLGVNGMHSPEDTYVLKTVLAKRHAPLKLVVVEASGVEMCMQDGANGTVRAVYWHDFTRFLSVFRSVLETKFRGGGDYFYRHILWPLDAIRYDFDIFLNKTLSVGRGLEWVNAPLDPKELLPLADIGKRGDGYVLYDTPPDAIEDEEWALLQSRLKKPMEREPVNRASQDELHDKRRMVEALGGEVITFVPPQGGKCFVFDSKIAPCLNFADPARYPELYQRENRKDAGHLNQRGAEVFTRRLVEQIVALKSRQQ